MKAAIAKTNIFTAFGFSSKLYPLQWSLAVMAKCYWQSFSKQSVFVDPASFQRTGAGDRSCGT